MTKEELKTGFGGAFGSAVEGKIPDTGAAKAGFLGRELHPDKVTELARVLRGGINDGVLNLIAHAATMNAVKLTVAMPSGGLAPKGDEQVSYKYKGEEMFGLGPKAG
jgi:hypothetical protein